jgi:predicted alpha-1,2-mannosidase
VARVTVALAVLGVPLVAVGTTTGPTAAAVPKYVSDPLALVNPFIGTGGKGNTFPGADVPFGMVQWSPDTTPRSSGGGYVATSSTLLGYSLTHLSGPGCPVAGDVPILPTTGAVGSNPGAATEPMDHSEETASPGYYQLDAGGVDTQLTTTTRSGMATFTFPTTATQGNLVFKLSDSETPVTASQFTVVDDEEVAGSVTTGTFCGAASHYTVYFDMVFNTPFASSGTYSTGGSGGYVSFDTAGAPIVQAKVGLSYVSTANAVLNWSTEDPGWTFATVESAAQQLWQSLLDRLQIGGGTVAQQTVFYTALYHSLLEPNVFSDVNGQYLGMNGQMQQVVAPQTAQYANYSGWDGYRSEVQLEALVAPQQTSDIVSSMLNDFAQSGRLPKWAENASETYLMVGDPADGIIADAYAFGATNFNTATALRDMEAEATTPNRVRPGLSYDETDGYLPTDGTYGCCDFYGPVPTQEEYDVADNAIAQFATALGKTTVAGTYATRAQNWQNVFNPASGFVQPKESDGVFAPGFSPTSPTGFVEGDSYIYTAMLPFDVAGAIAAHGGDANWIAYLNGLTANVTGGGPTEIQMSNEPSFDIPWEYDYAGAPADTQQVVRQIQTALYSDTTTGLAGNDDLGALSSWYVWSALGGFPEMPGSAALALGSPAFPAIAIALPDGKSITEVAPAAAPGSPYVDGLTLNGATWSGASLRPNLLTNGGTLHWTLGATPTTWASDPADAPPSNTAGLLPALGFLAGADGGAVTGAPGAAVTLTLGAQSQSGVAQQVNWTATASSGSGLVLPLGTGSVAVASEASVTQGVEVDIPPTTAAGQYLVTFALTSGTGVALPAVVAPVDVS